MGHGDMFWHQRQHRRLNRRDGFALLRTCASAHRYPLIDHLDQSVLVKAFRGELVPQDPNDESASILLERIKTEWSAAQPAGGGEGRA
jgi:hypothetical protein